MYKIGGGYPAGGKIWRLILNAENKYQPNKLQATLQINRYYHSLSQYGTNSIAVIGGVGARDNNLKSCELYNTAT